MAAVLILERAARGYGGEEEEEDDGDQGSGGEVIPRGIAGKNGAAHERRRRILGNDASDCDEGNQLASASGL